MVMLTLAIKDLIEKRTNVMLMSEVRRKKEEKKKLSVLYDLS